jgi:3-mercaptopyruvate sulfurtransferase SseA
MRVKVFAFLVLFGSLFLTGCNAANPVERIGQAGNSNANPQASPQATYADGARRITIKELNDMMKKGEAFIVDVRNEPSYNAGHIPGAKLIPFGEILNHINELPKDKLIVTYCS